MKYRIYKKNKLYYIKRKRLFFWHWVTEITATQEFVTVKKTFNSYNSALEYIYSDCKSKRSRKEKYELHDEISCK